MSSIQKNPYRMPSVTLGVMPEESRRIAEIYLTQHNWNDCRSIYLNDDVMTQKTLAGRKRVFSEIKYRLQQFSEDELLAFKSADLNDQKLLIYLAACRGYPFLKDWVLEVLREKFISGDHLLRDYEFEQFWDQKSSIYPQVQNLGESSKSGIRKAVFRFLAEVEIFRSSKDLVIQAPRISHLLVRLLKVNSIAWLKIFLLSDKEIQSI